MFNVCFVCICICVVSLVLIYYDIKKTKDNYGFIDLKFDTIMTFLDIPVLGKHDALNDAIMTYMIFLKLKNLAKQKKINF